MLTIMNLVHSTNIDRYVEKDNQINAENTHQMLHVVNATLVIPFFELN